jgi:hypothetical protein
MFPPCSQPASVAQKLPAQQHRFDPHPLPSCQTPSESHEPWLHGSTPGVHPHWPAFTSPHIGIDGNCVAQSSMQFAVRLQYARGVQ